MTARSTSLPGFGSRHPRQELGSEGARSQGAPYGLNGRHRGGSMVAADGEQHSGASVGEEQSGVMEEGTGEETLHCARARG
jgi:hypothetical protein